MPGRMQYSEEVVKKAKELTLKIGPTRAGRILGIEESTLRGWAKKNTVSMRSRSQSELLEELSKLIIRFGVDMSVEAYQRIVPHNKEWKRHWSRWPEFRAVAARLCPYARRYNVRADIELQNGLIVVGSDAHYWPGWGESTAHRFLLQFLKQHKPAHVVLNGDVLDLPTVSLHRPIAFKKEPTPKEEIDEVQLRLGEIRNAARGATFWWNWGNHDLRMDNRLAEKLPELEDISGMSISEHFPGWKFQNAIRVNETQLEIKHRFKSGMYATRLNPLHAGISYCTGHDHNAQIYRVKNLRGTIWGVNTGMMADPWGPAFEYQENNPSNHESAIGVLTFRDGKLLPPELAIATEPGRMIFRGEVYDV